MKVCPNCGRENPADARFCANCATPLEPRAAPREERKVVTVLFCDLVGSTARAEKLDPEDVRAALSRYHERVRAELERYGGTVEKFIGDAVMALFGAPIAHEDDPERAVRAALAIRDWAAEEDDLHIRIGITTGEALVSLGARPNKGEGMAAGDVVNTAARLQAAAQTDAILVDETTYRATDRVIDYRGREAIEAKGKAKPVAVWEAQQARSRFGVDVRQVARAPLIGRDHELGTLVGALARVKREREPQLVTLVGEPGIGKSRLVWELFRTVEEGPDLVSWRQGRSLPYGDGIALWALGEMVKAHAGVLESDDVEGASEKLDGAVRQLVDDEPDWVIGHLRPLIGTGMPTEPSSDRRTEAFAAWRRFFEAAAEQRPLVLVFEDLHWADDSLLDFIDYLVDWAVGVSLLVICTARPELLARRPDWSGGKTNATTLRVGALTDNETAQLVHALLVRPVLSAQVQSALLARAGGNPLYAEEFVRLLGDEDSAEAMPESVQGLIAARLDVLPPDEKGVVQDASVIGKVFWMGAVAAIGGGTDGLEDRLHALERKDFVRRERRSSVGGETEYAFRHALVRDAAYTQIPRSTRAEKHRRAAEWLEALGRPDDHADLLAHHYVSALELARAAGNETQRLEHRARLALREAGDRASTLGSFGAAGAYYKQALALWPDDDAEHSQLMLKLGKMLRFAAPNEARETLHAASRTLEATGDLEGTVEAKAALGELAFESRGARAALDDLARAVALARELPASRAKAHALSSYGRVLMFIGRTDESVENAMEALRLAEELRLADVRAQALLNLGTARVRKGDYDGIADIRRSIEIASAANSPECLRGYWNLAQFLHERGEVREATETAAEGKRAAERFGVPEQAAQFDGFFVYLHLERGNWTEALRLWRNVQDTVPPGDFMVDSMRHYFTPLIAIARGELEAGVRTATEGLAHARETRPDDPEMVGGALVLYAWALLETGRTHEARMVASELEKMLAGETAAPLLNFAVLGLVIVVLGLSPTTLGALTRAAASPWREILSRQLEGDFVGSADACAAIDLRLSEAFLRLRAAEALLEGGRRHEADEELSKALSFFRSIGATHFVRRSESLLAATA